MSKWTVAISKVANVGVHKMLRITCEIPQEFGAEFIQTMGWPTEEKPIMATLELSQPATEGKAAEIAPMVLDKPLETERPAGVHNPYSRRAGILSGDKLFHRYIDALGDDHATFAASYIRNFCKVMTRKDILPGSEAATRFDLLESAFIGWRDGPKHGAAA